MDRNRRTSASSIAPAAVEQPRRRAMSWGSRHRSSVTSIGHTPRRSLFEPILVSNLKDQ